jgi:hypothetical protein
MNKWIASQLSTQFCWYALTPVWPDNRRVYLVLFRKSGLGSVTIPFAVLYLLIDLIVLISPHCRLPADQQRIPLCGITLT